MNVLRLFLLLGFSLYSTYSLRFHGVSSLKLQKSLKNRQFQLNAFEFNAVTAAEIGAASGGLYLLLQLGVYWRMQFISAGIISGIPPDSSVVELDAQDGKNVFYLPKNSDYIAIMSRGDDKNPEKMKEKTRINEQLILECVGRANREGLNVKGRVRADPTEIPPKSVDCVFSVGALARAAAKDSNPNRAINDKIELIREVYRMLKPGGLFVFVEPDNDETLVTNLFKVFPEEIKESAVKKQEKLSANEELLSKGTKGKKNKEKAPKNKKYQKKNTFLEQPETKSIIEETEEKEKTDEIISSKEDPEEKSTDDSLESSTESSTGRKRLPGVTSTRIQNVFFPHITGVAVRPP